MCHFGQFSAAADAFSLYSVWQLFNDSRNDTFTVVFFTRFVSVRVCVTILGQRMYDNWRPSIDLFELVCAFILKHDWHIFHNLLRMDPSINRTQSCPNGQKQQYFFFQLNTLFFNMRPIFTTIHAIKYARVCVCACLMSDLIGHYISIGIRHLMTPIGHTLRIFTFQFKLKWFFICRSTCFFFVFFIISKVSFESNHIHKKVEHSIEWHNKFFLVDKY